MVDVRFVNFGGGLLRVETARYEVDSKAGKDEVGEDEEDQKSEEDRAEELDHGNNTAADH